MASLCTGLLLYDLQEQPHPAAEIGIFAISTHRHTGINPPGAGLVVMIMHQLQADNLID